MHFVVRERDEGYAVLVGLDIGKDVQHLFLGVRVAEVHACDSDVSNSFINGFHFPKRDSPNQKYARNPKTQNITN